MQVVKLTKKETIKAQKRLIKRQKRYINQQDWTIVIFAFILLAGIITIAAITC